MSLEASDYDCTAIPLLPKTLNQFSIQTSNISTMCLHITRSCPSCRTATEYVENHNCDKVPTCPNVESSSLPLRRENFSTWDCPTRKCSFNTGYLRNLERKHVLARVAQIEGDSYTLDSSLTPDGKLYCYGLYVSSKEPQKMVR